MEYSAKDLDEEKVAKLAKKEELEYTKKKDKLEKKLTKAYEDNDIRRIVEIKEKLLNLCKNYAGFLYGSYVFEYTFKNINGVMRIIVDAQKMKTDILSSAQKTDILINGRKKVEYSDDYFYENKDDQAYLKNLDD